MYVYNRNLTDAVFETSVGRVLIKGKWNRLQDKDQTAIEGNFGCTKITDEQWSAIINEFKTHHYIKSGEIFSAKTDNEASKIIEDSPKASSSRLDLSDIKKKGFSEFGKDEKSN